MPQAFPNSNSMKTPTNRVNLLSPKHFDTEVSIRQCIHIRLFLEILKEITQVKQTLKTHLEIKHPPITPKQKNLIFVYED